MPWTYECFSLVVLGCIFIGTLFGGRIGVDMSNVLYFRITAKLQIHSDLKDCIEIKLVKIFELFINGVFRSSCGTTVTIDSHFGG